MRNDQRENTRPNVTRGYVPVFEENEDGFYEEKDIFYPMPEDQEVKQAPRARSKKYRTQQYTAKHAKPRKPKKKKGFGCLYALIMFLCIIVIASPFCIYYFGGMYLDKQEANKSSQTYLEQEQENQKQIEEERSAKEQEEKEKKAEEERLQKEKEQEEKDKLYEKESADSDYIYYVELTDGTEITTKSESEYNDLISEHRDKGDLSYYHWKWDPDDNQYTREDNE